MIELLRKQYVAHPAFSRYFMISVFVTLLDTAVSRISELFAPLIVANSMGIIIGFLTQYVLASRHVYNNKDVATFIKFLLTFCFGFSLANGIVYVSRVIIFSGSEAFIVFLVSKGFSIVIPFFAMYYIRRSWIKTIPVVKDEPITEVEPVEEELS